MRHQMDTRLRSLFSDSQSPLQSSSGDSVNHEKRVERIIHNLCCAESGLDPFQLAALTQEPLTTCLFGKWDNEYQSDRNFSTIFDKLSQGQAVEGFSLFQGKLRHHGKIVVPFSLTDKVLTAMHQYVHPGRDKLIELVRRKFYFTFRPSVLKKKVTELVKRCPVCQTCKTGPARFDECRFFPVPQYPFASLAIDFVSLPEITSAGQVYDQCMVIVDRLTGYLTAVPCRAQGLDAKAAADLFLQRCLFFTGVPKEIMSDNDNVITSDFFHSLCEKMGIETHRGVMYRPSSNGRAENAVKAVVNLLCLYLEQRKALWVNALPLAVWAVNDLPGIHSPYSPHRLVFGRDPIGFGDCPPVQDDCAEGRV